MSSNHQRCRLSTLGAVAFEDLLVPEWHCGTMHEETLPGGFINEVVRVGDTVRRPQPESAEYVVSLLRHFERVGWPGAPRYLGIDDEGRQMLSYVDGHVAWDQAQPPDVWSQASLERVAKLVRQLHDLTAGTYLARDQEVVCHNDLSPKNTVYRDSGDGLRPVTFLDWDIAAPGRRIHDVAMVCWQYLDLGPRRTNPAGAARLLRVICDAYGLRERTDLVETIRWWQVRTWSGIEEGAITGDEAMIGLRRRGVVEDLREAFDWVTQHRDTLETALT